MGTSGTKRFRNSSGFRLKSVPPRRELNRELNQELKKTEPLRKFRTVGIGNAIASIEPKKYSRLPQEDAILNKVWRGSVTSLFSP